MSDAGNDDSKPPDRPPLATSAERSAGAQAAYGRVIEGARVQDLAESFWRRVHPADRPAGADAAPRPEAAGEAMKRIVTSTYRYKRPPRKRQAVALEVPAMGGAGAAWAIALAAMTLVSAQANAGPSVWNGDEAQQQRPAPQTTPRPANDATLSSWMRSWHQASDMCRGTYPGAEHDHWCQLSAIYGSKLEDEGCHTVFLGTAMSSVRWACPNSLSGDR